MDVWFPLQKKMIEHLKSFQVPVPCPLKKARHTHTKQFLLPCRDFGHQLLPAFQVWWKWSLTTGRSTLGRLTDQSNTPHSGNGPTLDPFELEQLRGYTKLDLRNETVLTFSHGRVIFCTLAHGRMVCLQEVFWNEGGSRSKVNLSCNPHHGDIFA